MTRWKLRTQVALAAAAAIFLAVVVLGGAVQLLLARQLNGQLDHTLRDRATDVATLSASAPGLLTTPGALDSSRVPGGLDVEVVDRHGALVARSLSLGSQLLPAEQLLRAAITQGRAVYGDAHLGSEPVRLYAAPLADVGGGPAAGGAVVVSASTEPNADTLADLRRLVVFGGLAAALIAATAALLLTRRVLRPLEQLSGEATLIQATADPSRRLAVESGNEVGTLAAALNGMLEALERARDNERRFLADASHELRTPLTALRGNAAYLARNGGDAAAFADLEADIARLGHLVDTLLAVAREDAAPSPEAIVDLAALAEELAANDSQVTVDLRRRPAVRGDADALRRAVANLIENAHRYGPAGAPITLVVESEGATATIAVVDTGAGLPAGVTAAQAQRRFWRGPTSGGHQGSGLGLALAGATAQRHGGRLMIDGPRFAIQLPALTDLSSLVDRTPSQTPVKDRG